MNIKLFAAAFAATSLLAAGAASAGTILSLTPVNGNAIPLGETLITDFNSTGGVSHTGNLGSGLQHGAINDLAPGFTFTPDSLLAYTRDGVAGLDPNISAPPPLNNGVGGAYYETVLTNGSATLTSDSGLKQFSFYMGSPDDYNHVTFTFVGVNGTVIHKDGTQVWGGAPPGNGDQGFGTTVIYKFGPEAVKSITFTATGNSFEFDRLAGIAVPEPTSWALMIMGFGFAGGMVRAKRRAQATA
jgi:hypothetical protein